MKRYGQSKRLKTAREGNRPRTGGREKVKSKLPKRKKS